MFELLRVILGGCKHKQLSPVQKDGFQYCEECGKAFLAPRYETCVHEWIKINEYSASNRLTGNMYKITYVLKCKHCGDMKTYEIK